MDLWAGGLSIQCFCNQHFILLVSRQKDDEGDEVCQRKVCLFVPWQGAVRRRRFHPLQSPWKLQNIHNIIVIIQGHTIAERRVAQATKFWAAARYICSSSASNSLRVAQLSPRNLECQLGFWKKCAPWSLSSLRRLHSYRLFVVAKFRST
jgi:hypothetical protein